jgi:hypothetical protein
MLTEMDANVGQMPGERGLIYGRTGVTGPTG